METIILRKTVITRPDPMQTSRDAYKNIKESGLLTERERQVYGAISTLGGATNLEISKHLGLPINCVTGRTRDLVDKRHRVMCIGEKYCPETGKMHTVWGVV